MPATSTVLTVSAATKALDKILTDIYVIAKESGKQRIKRWRTESKVRELYKSVTAVRKVKTIWQIDKEVDLMSFYYPSRLKVYERRKVINSVLDLPYHGNIVVQGTVGQGKSIFLRYLCSQELTRGEAIPVFLELRHYDGSLPLRSLVLEALRTLRLEMDDELLDVFAERGRLTLLLDAFDEVDEEHVGSVISQLEELSKRYERLRIIVTSRPDSGIEKSAHFRVFQLAPLESDELAPVIERLTGSAKLAHEIATAVRKSAAGISSLLTTPLMVTLLVFTYKAEQRVPEQLSEFYDGLFQLLLARHDKSKPGYSRKRRCKVADRVMREVFEALCFLARRARQLSFTEEGIHSIAKEAIKLTQIAVDVDDYVSDIRRITCLLLEEGGRYQFIHKSVAEYHAACFIRRQPQDTAIRFYQQLINEKWVGWHQELEFLWETDTYRFDKHFLLPKLQNYAGRVHLDDEENVKRAFSAHVEHYVRSMEIHFRNVASDSPFSYSTISEPGPYGWPLDRINVEFADYLMTACIMRFGNFHDGGWEIYQTKTDGSDVDLLIRGDDVLGWDDAVIANVKEAINDAVDKLWQLVNVAKATVLRTDDQMEIVADI
jgi:hypothetical protein